MKRALIGVSMDLAEDPRGPELAVHQLRSAYADAVVRAGGVPWLLPSMPPEALDDALEVAFEHLGGLLLSGGGFDVSPELYGAPPSPKLGQLKPTRTRFELALLARAAEHDLPVLGICGGMQLMNVARGGSLYQHLPDELPNALQHEQATDRRQPSHDVEVRGAWSDRLGHTLAVNSSHHQGVKDLGDGLRTFARSPDELIEGFESLDGHWVGVEWHPELLWDSVPAHRELFSWLIGRAKT